MSLNRRADSVNYSTQTASGKFIMLFAIFRKLDYPPGKRFKQVLVFSGFPEAFPLLFVYLCYAKLNCN